MGPERETKVDIRGDASKLMTERRASALHSACARVKYAAEFKPPLLIVASRFTAGGSLMFCLLRILEPADRLKPKDLLSVAGLGCLGVAIGQTAFTFGVSKTSAANTGLIFATAPIWGQWRR